MSIELEPKPDKPKPAGPPPQQARPSILNYYARAAASEARRFRQGITRENITTFLKTMAWTIPLTVLIWVYAERQEEVNEQDIPVAIDVISKDSHKTAELLSTDRVIMCDLTGPRSNLDRLKESLSTSDPIKIEVDTRPLPNQDNYIQTLESIRDNSRFKEAGVTVDKCTPASLKVTVDSVETREWAVKAPELPTLQSAEFNPSTVKVTGPMHLVEALGQVTADIGGLPIWNQPGPHPSQMVPLLIDPAGPLTYSPSQVEAKLIVKEQDEQYQAQSVPIWIVGPPGFLKDWSIVPSKDSLATLNLTGPPEEIDKISRGEVSVRAILYVGPDNVHTSAEVPLAVQFWQGQEQYVPTGVHVVGQNPQITFTATPRNP